MTTRRKKLTEEIKAGVRAAAAELFAEKGYNAVTMREIAKAAGCSHTAIYLYFKNKDDLLQQIAMPPLEELEGRMLEYLQQRSLSPLLKLKALSREYAVYCLTNASIHRVMFMSGSVRVDEAEPELELNRIRNRLFAHFMAAVKLAVEEGRREPAGDPLNDTRVMFYYVQGFVSTYSDHSEPTESLLKRTLPILEEGIEVFAAGIRARG